MTKPETVRLTLVLVVLLGVFVLAVLAPSRSYRLKLGEFVYEPAGVNAPSGTSIGN